MSTKTSIIIVTLLVVAVGAWIIMGHSGTVATPQGSSQSVSLPSNPNPTGSQTNTISASDNSDTALNTDLNNIDNEMGGLNSDTASADNGLSNPNQ